jgi:lysozyme
MNMAEGIADALGATVNVVSIPSFLTPPAAPSIPQTVRGIDIYHGDTGLDFHALAAAGVQFCYIKATQGTSMIDTQYGSNRSRGQSVGMLTAGYGFIMPGLDGENQAEHLLNNAPVVTGDIVHVLDVETFGAGIADTARACADKMKSETGRYPFIYSGDAFYQDNLRQAFPVGDFNLIIARYGGKPMTPCIMWQFSDAGRFGGNPPLDSDIFYGSLADLQTHTYS